MKPFHLMVAGAIFLICTHLQLIDALSFPVTSSKSTIIDGNFMMDRRTTFATAASIAAATSKISPAQAASPMSSSITLPGSKKPFPLASFGLQIYNDDVAYKLTLVALEAGYRNFFASVLAGNQKGFAKAIKDSGVPREDLYICGTVLSNRANTEKDAYDLTKKGVLENLDVMQKGSNGKIDRLDMIMLDYPCKTLDGVVGQWKAFQETEKGNIDDLAVSNFNAAQLDAILVKMKDRGELAFKPVVNQLPYSVAYHPKGMIDYNTQRDVFVQSWSPLSRVLTNSAYKKKLSEIGKKYNKSAAQVGLRYIIDSGASFCTQSKKAEHFVEDLNVFDFELTGEEIQDITSLTVA